MTKSMSFALDVENVTCWFDILLVPELEAGNPTFGSNGELKFAPDIPHTIRVMNALLAVVTVMLSELNVPDDFA